MIVGFTGTQRGMTEHQKQLVADLLVGLQPTLCVHGGCIGADADFHDLCFQLGMLPIRVLPSDIPNKQSAHVVADSGFMVKVMAPRPPLVRNHLIVDSIDILIACPAQDHEVLRSGTWATIRYARKTGKPTHIIYCGTQSGNGSGRSV